jgi:hypothetical protein
MTGFMSEIWISCDKAFNGHERRRSLVIGLRLVIVTYLKKIRLTVRGFLAMPLPMSLFDA